MSTASNRRWYFLAGAGLALVLGGLSAWYVFTPTPEPVTESPTPTATTTQATTTTQSDPRTIIGQSVEGRPIAVHEYGTGDELVLFVGGIHGGYEWNSVLLAYQMIDHFARASTTIPANLRIGIIPNLNPDGLYAATGLEGRFSRTDITNYRMHDTGTGRFNANGVDLNRNFACNWAPKSTWRGQTVSAGTKPFSEPEAAALRDYVTETQPKAVAFWHSRANTVYASECNNGVLPKTLDIMNAYAEAGNYNAVPSFDAYPITGDAEGWLASIGIPAITVELNTRTDPEWEQNLAGVRALLRTFTE